MVEMAKAHNVNIYHYLAYVMEQRPNEAWSDDQLEAIAPWNENLKTAIKQQMDARKDNE